jgi:hypothetical protein
MLAKLRKRFPDRRIAYRPKRIETELPNCSSLAGDIADAIRGSSLVVCSHSNVAVDACFAGIPVECEDGATLALYRDNPSPTREQRLEFLRSLAWWNWSVTEASEAWKFIRAQLCA